MTPDLGKQRGRRRPERVAVSLSAGERTALRDLARANGEPEATTAGRLLRAGLASAGAALDAPVRRRRGPTATSAPRERATTGAAAPRWLPTSYRAAAIAALGDRYPQELRTVPADLSGDRLLAERLAALSVWRDELDAGLYPDPRAELSFSGELVAIARWLEERSRRRGAPGRSANR